MLQIASLLFLGHDDFSHKIIQDYTFAPVLTNKIPRRRRIASAKYQSSTIVCEVVSLKALGILPAIFHGTPVASEKSIRTLYWSACDV